MITHILHSAAGNPEMVTDTNGACRVCGARSIGLSFARWVRPTFTDHDKLQTGNIICQACQFSFGEKSDLLATTVGKEKPQRMRNYSHFVLHGKWIPCSKADKPKMYQLLTQNPQVAIIAVSGQKHLIFRAQPGWWQVEEQSVLPFPETLEELLAIVEDLYTSFSKSEIATGDYRQHKIIKFGLEKWHVLESQISPWRGSVQLELALFLAQKGNDDTTTRESSGYAANHLERDTEELQKAIPGDDLGTIRESDQERGVHEQRDEIRQLSLL